MNQEQHTKLFEWMIAQYFAVEADTLSYRQRCLFLDMIEESKDHWLTQDTFKEFIKRSGKTKKDFDAWSLDAN